MGALPRPPEAEGDLADVAAGLNARLAGATPHAIIEHAVTRAFPGAIAAVSSFGADSAALLHMIAKIDRRLPVLFLDTGRHFGETLGYRDALAADFGLTNVISVAPLADRVTAIDPAGDLHGRDHDACCALRKVEPMARAVAPYAAWFTGRKRFQAATRAALPVFETVGPRIRINPLASLTAEDLAEYAARHQLRANPLVAYGFRSIGCFPCTRAVAPGEDARAGRWAGSAKTECGIHLSGLDASLTDSSL